MTVSSLGNPQLLFAHCCRLLCSGIAMGSKWGHHLCPCFLR